MSEAELERVPLVSRLGADERRALAEELESLEVPPGTVLFEEGDRAEGLVIVAQGRVRVSSRRTPEATLGPGAALGAFSLASAGPREARAETTSHSRLLVLRRDAYERLVAHAPHAACRLLECVIADAAALLRDDLDGFTAGFVDPPPRSD